MPPPRSTAAGAAALFLLLAFTLFRPPSTGGPIERDFEAYYAAGVTVDAAGDPYSRAIWTAEQRIPGVDASRDELLPFVGPAAALPFWGLLARLPYHAALCVWTAILLAALAGIVAAALAIAPAPRAPATYGAAILMTLASAPAIAALALGQAALVAAAGIAGAIAAYRVRWMPGAFVGTLIAALQPNLAIALVGRIRSRWDLGVAACAAVAFTLAALAAGGGLPGISVYLRRLSAHGSAERAVAIQHTPAAIGYALGLPAQGAAVLGAAIAVLAGTAAVVIIVRERLDPSTATLVASALLPLALPFFHEPDFALELCALLVLAVRAQGPARAPAAVAAVLVLVDWFGLAQRSGAGGQILCFGLAVAFAFAALPRAARRWRRGDLAGVLAFLVLAAIVTPFAFAHTAPTWPDLLPSGYRAPAAADVSAVWGDEQRAAGLTRRDPIWGFLRALPLAGCIVLTAALVADARSRRRRLAGPYQAGRLRRSAADAPALPAELRYPR